MEKTSTPDPAWAFSIFEDAQAAMENVWLRGNEGTHGWHRVQREKNPLHPVVKTILQTYRPVNWQDLLMQWPYVSETDPMRLAYTPSEEYGAADRQVITSIGKYVHKHWPHVKDDVLRDAASLYTPDTFKIVDSVEAIIMGCENGPKSCMASRSSYCSHDFKSTRGLDDHPYRCYDPALGWRMALRVAVDGTIMARALLNEKVFVRTYGRTADDPELSTADTALRAWLEASGYEKGDSWPRGTRLRCRALGGSIQAPYLDGDNTRLSYHSGDTYTICSDGDYDGCQTNGLAENNEDEEDENAWVCACCEGTFGEDESATTVGREGHEYACESCLSRRYTEVRGDHNRSPYYREYYIIDRTAEEVRDHDYCIDSYSPPDGVLQLADGCWAETADTVSVGDENYMCGDDVLCETSTDDGNGSLYALKADCWQDHTGQWHRDIIECVELDGENYTAEEAEEIIHERQEELELEEVTA